MGTSGHHCGCCHVGANLPKDYHKQWLMMSWVNVRLPVLSCTYILIIASSFVLACTSSIARLFTFGCEPADDIFFMEGYFVNCVSVCLKP